MSGTVDGGQAARDTNYKRHGSDFYMRVGHRGGIAHVSKGFGTNSTLARRAGSLGGKTSRRPPAGALAKSKACTYCEEHGHLAYDCAIRQAVIARRNYVREEQQADRDKLSRIAAKWAKT